MCVVSKAKFDKHSMNTKKTEVETESKIQNILGSNYENTHLWDCNEKTTLPQRRQRMPVVGMKQMLFKISK